MVERHEREIAPLLQRRALFAESSNFLLYDFFQDSGRVDENVFAYSNRNGNDRAVVVYNNRYGETRGTIDFSAAYADKSNGQLRQQRLREGLGLSDDPAMVFAWRDSLTGLEFLRRANDLSERGLTLDLHAYECHVFLDWQELRSTASQPWDRLCDQLNGSGVPNLQDALVNLELRPVHDALRLQLDPAVVRLFADLAEHPRALAAGNDIKIEQQRRELFDLVWSRCENFLRVAQNAYASRQGIGAAHAGDNALLAPVFRERLRAAMRIPSIEALFAAPWTAAARRVLPSPSPQFTATAMWGPVLGWCVLELLAESIDPVSPESVALDLFDRLRLREPFAQAFTALGFEDEEGWRVAARIKVVLLTGSGIGKPENSATEASPAAEPETPKVPSETVIPAVEEQVPEPSADAAEESSTTPGAASTAADERIALSPGLWHDPDVRWLTGVHEADGHSYLVREMYEELLWWLLMPSLLRLAGEAAPSRVAVEEMSKTVSEALATAESAGYRIDILLGEAKPQFTCDASEPEVESQQTGPDEVEPHEPEIEKPEIENPEPEQAEAENPQPQVPGRETPPKPDPVKPV
jgi:hypothetical protein